jgi:quinol monooxygenase YgiN
MITAIAKLHADPQKVQRVRETLEDMVDAAKHSDPELSAYSVHVAADDPSLFLVYEQYSSVEGREEDGQSKRLMELGTALRESLREPIHIERYEYVKGLDVARG